MTSWAHVILQDIKVKQELSGKKINKQNKTKNTTANVHEKYGIKVKMRQKCKNETENSAQNFQNIYETDKVK